MQVLKPERISYAANQQTATIDLSIIKITKLESRVLVRMYTVAYKSLFSCSGCVLSNHLCQALYIDSVNCVNYGQLSYHHN